MNTTTQVRSFGWLDSLAIGFSVLCAIHCLLTPVLLVVMPILGSTIWVDENFHLWMILFVVPTTTLAVFMGCRKHKDKAVVAFSVAGVALLVSVALYETFHTAGAAAQGGCPSCAGCETATAGILGATTLVNVLGGLCLVSAHARNFLLCRKSSCKHDCKDHS